MNEIDYNSITADLCFWIETWKDKRGAYNGPVIHRRDLKRLKKIHDTPWSQASIINGYLNLYDVTFQKKYLEAAVLAAEPQCGNLMQTGEFKNAGHEDDRFSSLVHNALADCALLNLCGHIKSYDNYCELYDKLIACVRKNFDDYIIKRLFSEEQTVFKFNDIDYYSDGENRCVCNMNSITAEAFIRFQILTGENTYDKYINNINVWIRQFINTDDGINKGAISYSHTQKNVYISIYTALALRGICMIYDYTKDESIKYFINLSANNLVGFMENGMFMHESNNGTVYSKPWFISGSGMIFNALHLANKYLGNIIDEKALLNRFLKYRHPNGAFMNFIGYDSAGNRLGKRKDGGIVWEDVFPTLSWNAQMFEYLSNYCDTDYKDVNNIKSVKIFNPKFIYYESIGNSFVISWFPLKSIAVLLYKKKKDTAVLAFSLVSIVRKVRENR